MRVGAAPLVRLSLGSSALIAMLLAALAAPPLAAGQDGAALEAARLHFEAGQAEYAAGRFEEALTDFRAAYATTSAPEILYNIATVLDRLRRDAEAADAYERYLAAVPTSPERANLTARIELLRSAHGAPVPDLDEAPEEQAVVEPPPEDVPLTTVVEPPPEPPPAASADPTGWVLLGVGLGVAVAGGVLLGVSEADASTVRASDHFPDVRSAFDRVPIESGIGWAALGVGVAMAGVGLAVALTSGSGSGDARVTIGPTGAVLRVRL
jgi:tetratricopeptide (TPR) repeat protein